MRLKWRGSAPPIGERLALSSVRGVTSPPSFGGSASRGSHRSTPRVAAREMWEEEEDAVHAKRVEEEGVKRAH